MFRRSKNNSYDTSQTKQRFSIKKFKVGAASVLIGLSFLGGVTQGNLNIFEESIVAASTIPGSAATLNTSITKNIQNGNAYIDLYDVKLGKIDPLQLIVLEQGFTAKYVFRQGTKYYGDVSQLQSTGRASLTYNIFGEDGLPHVKTDGQIDIVSVALTIYDSTTLRDKIEEVRTNANDPKWTEESRTEVLTGLDTIKTDIDNNPKTQTDIDSKIVEVNELEKLLVLSVPDKDKYDPTGGETTVPQGTPVSDKEITDLVKIPDGSKGVPTVVGDRPDTNVPGDHKVTVDVTYPDGTKDTVEVTVHVTPKPVPDKDKYDPTGGETTVPQGTPVSDKENTEHVTPKPVPDKDKYDPTGGETTVPQGTPVSDKEITDLVKIPDGSKGVPTVVGDRPDTNVPGDHKVTVEVTYPDGTKDTVTVTIHVTPKPDKDKYDPTGKAQQVNGKGNKLPATGENATPFFNVAALTIISSVGLLSVSKKKED
ncbi:alpha-like surface protein [Streptococcus agalactiae]|uniref:alpha-like surface protein n=1 Tax=Streptococcus agalactiae TaxID=1311 RepID=UPI0013037DF5|nr:alpha-like surface protein [Streptococcus agalactiae]KAF0068148.1 alpha-like surface protein [Streptococcus agalactiae]